MVQGESQRACKTQIHKAYPQSCKAPQQQGFSRCVTCPLVDNSF